MNFDWTKPVRIDWSGRSGPLITEGDLKNSVIKRILRNQFYPPFCEREYISVKPWWDPQDPFGSHLGNNNSKHMFIPGLQPVPAYPQLSTLTKEQHLQGLKAMSPRFQFVQPKNYPQPTEQDIAAFESQAFQELYEAEQKEYMKWAKQLWLNGHCLRALRPKPTVERVYDAEFRMRANRMLSMPQLYSLAAQIPLEERGDCEMVMEETLINVNIQELPEVEYPEEMERDFSVLMKSCPVPEPCKQHPCKFVLPHEERESILPLSEIHRELAHYAAENGSTFVASENALRCLLETDRSWKIPVSVVEVVCPDYGDLKTIVVLGSEFSAQKECSTQRTYKAYKHLLRHTFAPSTTQYKSKSPAKQDTPQKTTSPAMKDTTALRNNRFVSLDDDLDVSSDEDFNEKLLIADNDRKNEPKKSVDNIERSEETDRLLSNGVGESIDQDMHETNIDDPIEQCITRPTTNIDEYSTESDQLPVHNHIDTNSVPSNHDSYEPVNQPIETNFLTNLPNYANPTPNYGLDFYDPDFNKNDSSYSQNEPFSTNSETGLDFYRPDYNIDSRPNYSRNEPSKPGLINSCEILPEFMNESNFSGRSKQNSRELNVASIEEPSSEPDQLMIDNLRECNPESNRVLNFYELDDDTRQSSPEPDQMLINNTSKLEANVDTTQANNTNEQTTIFKTKNHSLFEINDDTTQMQVNVDVPTKHVATKCEAIKKETLSRKPVKSEENEAPKTLSPVKPCRISVRNLGISELKSYNLTTFLNSPKTEKMHPIVNGNSDVSIINESTEKSPEGPARLGISGIITRQRKSISNKLSNETVIKTIKEVSNLGVLTNSDKQRSSHKIDHLPTVDTAEDERHDISEIIRNQSAVETCTNTNNKPFNVNAKEVPNFGVTRVLTRNRSVSGTDNNIEGIEPITEKFKKNISETINKTVTSPTQVSAAKKLKYSLASDANDSAQNVKTTTITTENNKLEKTNKIPNQNDEVNKHISKANLQLSPVKPCKVSVAKMDINRLSRITERSLKTNTSLCSSNIINGGSKTISRKRSICETNIGTSNVTELDNKNANLKTYTRKSKNQSSLNTFCSNNSLKIHNENTSPFFSHLSVENETSFSNDTSQPSRKRRKQSDQIILEQSSCQIENQTKPRKRSRSKIENDFCVSEPSFDEESDRDMLFIDCPLDVNSIELHSFDIIEPNLHTSVNDPTNMSEILTSNDTSNGKTFSDLFGDDSDDEVIVQNNGVNIPDNIIMGLDHNFGKKLSFDDTENNLSLSNPDVMIKRHDSEDEIAGFSNGVAVPYKVVNNKEKPNAIRTNYLNSKQTLTKNALTKQMKTRSSKSISDSNDLGAKTPKQKINKEIGNISPRKSMRLLSRVDSKSNDILSKANATSNAKDNSETTEVLRRSRRFSDRASTKENTQPNTSQNIKDSPKTISKITSKEIIRFSSRRKSFPSMCSYSNKMNEVIRSKSLSNLHEISDTTHLQSHSYTTRSKSLNRDKLMLSARTKRYFRPSFNDDSSDKSGCESQDLEYNPNKSSCTKLLDPDKKTKPCTRSSLNAKKDVKKTKNKTELSVTPKRYSLRSTTAYASREQSKPVRTKTRKPRQNTNRSSTANESVEENIESSEIIGIKNEVNKPTSNYINQSTTFGKETYQTNKDVVENDTLQVLHFIEVPSDSQRSSKYANEIKMNDDHLCIENMEFDETYDASINTMHIDADSGTINTVTNANEVMKTDANDNSIKMQCQTKTNMYTETIESNSIDEDSNGSDFFNMTENDEFNVLHFTARSDGSESDEESLTIDDGDTTSSLNFKVTDNGRKADVITNNQTKNANDTEVTNTQSTLSIQFGESSKQMPNAREVERVIQTFVSTNDQRKKVERIQPSNPDLSNRNVADKSLPKDVASIGVFKCTCKGTPFETPPPRSFKKWKLKNKESHVAFNVIVHSSHRVRKGPSEVLLEPLVEYQAELGGSRPAPGRLRAAALSARLRENAALIYVRIEHDTGNVLVVGPAQAAPAPAAPALHAALAQLRHLRAGHYVLGHDPSHGKNAMLYSPGVRGEPALNLRPAGRELADAEDASCAKTPPELDLVMLPYHKHRAILPLAFTAHKLGRREDKKLAAARAKAPPAPIQWPKKKKKKKPRRRAVSQSQE